MEHIAATEGEYGGFFVLKVIKEEVTVGKLEGYSVWQGVLNGIECVFVHAHVGEEASYGMNVEVPLCAGDGHIELPQNDGGIFILICFRGIREEDGVVLATFGLVDSGHYDIFSAGG